MADGSPAILDGRPHAVVIGSGFGGLAAAIRLGARGWRVTVLERLDQPGGRARTHAQDGFTFDAGPTVVTDPDCLAELWRLSGRAMSDDIELMPVHPFYRLHWPDGTTFDYSNDDTQLRAEIARLDPHDVAGYARFLDYAEAVYREGYQKLGHVAFLNFGDMVKAAPSLARYQAWRSVYSMVSHFVRNDKLRQALSFHTLLVGGNPLNTSSIYTLIHALEKKGGVWFAKGGTHALIQAMVRHFERLGGTLILGDAVEHISTFGNRATGVVTQSGRILAADAVASNADVMHSYKDLLGGHVRGAKATASLTAKKWSPSLFLVHFGIKGSWPGIPHHMILFGPRYEGLLSDIYDHGVLAQDFSLYLHHPTVTDPSLAPEGHSTFYALAPVPHLGKLPIDWDQVGPAYAERILDEIERRLIPDIRSRIVTRFHYAPPDFAHDLNAHMGSAFSLAPILTQSAFFRTHNRDDVIPNLYFTGAGTHPGAGIPGVVGSAKATAALMLEDLR